MEPGTQFGAWTLTIDSRRLRETSLQREAGSGKREAGPIHTAVSEN
jgi:hypothetical protein